MATANSAQNKKQQSISSFFSKKPAAAKSQPKLPTRDENEKPIPAASGPTPPAGDEKEGKLFLSEDEDAVVLQRRASRKLKRILDDDDEEEEGDGLPDPKRLRAIAQDRDENPPEATNEDIRREEEELLRERRESPAKAPPAGGSSRGKAGRGGRTSKYLFSEGAAQNDDGDGEVDEGDDEQTRRAKERLHQRFVKKLGRPDSIAEIKRRNHFISEETAEGEDGGAGEDEDAAAEEEQPKGPAKGRKGVAAKKGASKLTPMEKQVIDIKRKHMDTILVVEVGYKFRFFGEDARVVAKELGIVCIPGKFRFDEHFSEAHLDRFASASIPVHRLHVHVKRLISAGHKVGVVRQIETAALKAAGDNRNAPFVRKLTNLYTKGTYIDDAEGLDPPDPSKAGSAPATGYLLCLTETNAKGWGTDEKVQVGIVAVQPATGDIIYDDFEDGFMRSEIETRLLHIAPCEFLIVGELSRATDKLVGHLSRSKTNVFGDQARVERVPKGKTMAAEAYSHISNFYAGKMKSGGGGADAAGQQRPAAHVLDKVHKLSEHVTVCLSAMITHMSEYGLEHVFDLTKYFQPFSARSHMLLNGNTLTSLEIYQNQTDHGERGSLFWTMDRTKTRFGHRLLRRWVGRPLLDRAALEARVAAVEELKDGEHSAAVEKLRRLLAGVKSDLEKSLIRVYYRRCARPELLGVLQTLQRIAAEYAHVSGPQDAGFVSPLLADAIASLPVIGDAAVSYLDRINPQAARDDDKYAFFRPEHETDAMAEHRAGIAGVEEELDGHRAAAAEKLGRRKPVDYVTVAGIEFLIEVDNALVRSVPASWAKISGTKKVSRFHTPEVVRLVRARDQHKEALAAACDRAFADLLAEIGARYQELRDCVAGLASLDALLSLAELAASPGYCKPEFVAAPDDGSAAVVQLEGVRHPMVEQLLLDAYVPNDIHLATSPATAPRALLITGPNMGGKSSYIRSVALVCIMAQCGSHVPAASARLSLLDAVLTRMGARDNMLRGESTFQVELSETADILRAATPRSLVLLDELGRGTSTHDGCAIAAAVLRHVVASLRCLALFITHYQALAALAEGFPAGELRNAHMAFEERGPGAEEGDEGGAGEAAPGGSEITFLYTAAPGVAHRSYGLNVARLANVPGKVLRVAAERSAWLEGRMRRGAVGRAMGGVWGLVGGEGRVRVREDDGEEGDGDVEALVAGIEQL